MEYVEKNVRTAEDRKNMLFLSACASLAVFIALTLAVGTERSSVFVPMLCSIPAFVFVMLQEKGSGPKPETIMNESPSAIGMMRLMIDRNRSLDSVVREVALSGPENIAKMFSKIVRDADTRASPDIRDSLNSMIASLPDRLSPFKRSMHLIMSASDSNDPAERMRMTKDANDTMLNGLKETGESYSSKLNAPCMMIFGLGVMVPMILVSILPMLSVGGQFSSASLDPAVIAFVTLILIPAAVAAVIIVISSGNPFYIRSNERVNITVLMPAAACVPLFILTFVYTNDLTLSMAISAIASGSLLFAVLYPEMKKEQKRTKAESVMGDALFDLGNRLLSGENFETALVSSFRKKDTHEMASSLERCIMMSRGDTGDAMRTVMNPYSEKTADLYHSVYVSSLKDLRDAGRLAVSTGHQLQDQTAVLNGIRNKLRNTLDMMTGTSAVFAPLILGISISMLAPLTNLAGGSGMNFTSPILMIYLIELAALISVLTTQLRCRGGLLTSLYMFSIMMPVALTVFMLSSNLPI
ncbi:MAG: hypothetical protein FWD92_06375 [Methanomassiliicoccaceae archaeon]|nr:hypothetical protein [Methanomassiliicoccaceae archaeon]